jgi:hypothetical protein
MEGPLCLVVVPEWLYPASVQYVLALTADVS